MGCCASNDAMPGYHQNGPSPSAFNPGVATGGDPTTGNSMDLAFLLTASGKKPFTPFNHPLSQGELGQASKLFYCQQYARAAEIYRKHIERLAQETVQQIDGLGQTEMSLGYYEWFVFRFYREGIQKKQHIGTVYDALSLCYQALKGDEGEIEQGMKWYMDRIDDYPENIGFLMGYANILNNKSIYEEAIDYYNRVLDLKPKWVRPLECMAYIYEYKRVEKKKSCELANKILTLEPGNRVALFVLARNGKTADEKIQLLKEVMKLHPNYARCLNEIGIVYGGTKKEYREAIKWYQKAIEVTPEYGSCYNNIGVNFELLKENDEAIVWYFRGIEKDKEYKAPHKNLSDIFDEIKASDELIKSHMDKYLVLPDYFYYYMGLSYYDKKKYDESIRYYMKSYDCANELKKDIYKLDNSTGITYDELKQNENALKYYTKCIEANPKYHSAYYNMAIVYKRENKTDDAINWYKKAIEANPRYSYAFNNLGNIYKNQALYEEAIKCYKQAVEHLSTYTLALVNMGVCYLKIENFREAFNAMERAKECLPTDNNNLSQGNKDFMKTTLQKFDKEGESWRQNGCITKDQKAKLKSLISSFESNFSKIASSEKEPVSIERVLKKEVLQIVRITHEDQFTLKNVDQVYNLIRNIYGDNEEYFQILPELFVQYFYNNVFEKGRPILEIEKELFAITKKLSGQTASKITSTIQPHKEADHKEKYATMKLKNFNPTGRKENLFRSDYFNNYQEVYAEIINVNEETGKSYADYKGLVDSVRKQSYGTLYGIGSKIPKDESQQYKVILRIFEKMFKAELTKERVNSIIESIDVSLKEKAKAAGSGKKIGLAVIVPAIMQGWTKQITKIVADRKTKQVKTACEVSDLLRAKIMFDSLDHLKKAIGAVDDICNIKGYQVLEMDNRLSKPQTQDVVFKIKIKAAVCELQLAIKQDEASYHFTHAIYEIERSPLGCIFGSYIFMSKGFQYPFYENCKDIVEYLSNAKSQGDKKTLKAAQYIVANMNAQ